MLCLQIKRKATLTFPDKVVPEVQVQSTDIMYVPVPPGTGMSRMISVNTNIRSCCSMSTPLYYVRALLLLPHTAGKGCNTHHLLALHVVTGCLCLQCCIVTSRLWYFMG